MNMCLFNIIGKLLKLWNNKQLNIIKNLLCDCINNQYLSKTILSYSFLIIEQSSSADKPRP